MVKRKTCVLLFLTIVTVNTMYSQSLVDKYQEILNNAHNNGLPAIVALVNPSGKSEWKGKAGFSNIENSTPLNVAQSFRLASITKIFTSVVVLQLIDEKKLTLSDPITNYLDSVIISKIPNADKITILHLLSHSSGIYSFTENNRFWKECFFNGGMSRTWEPNELIGYIKNKKPVNKPETPFTKKFYSNTNYILLGMIIEKVTGNALVDEYQERIFIPLKMKHTFLEGYDKQAQNPIDSYAIPSTYFLKSAMKKKGIKKIKETEYINLSKEYKLFNSWAWAAGGISSNLNDLSSFLSALRNGELLSKESQKTFLKLNTAEDKGITFFGGTGGGDGIQATMLHLMPSDITIIILINSTGHKQVSLGSVFTQLHKTAASKQK